MPPSGRMPLEIFIVLGNLALAVGLGFNARRRRSFASALPLMFFLVLQAVGALALAGQHIGIVFNPHVLGIVADTMATIAPSLLLGATLVYTRSGKRAWLLLILPCALAGLAFGFDTRIFGPRGSAPAINGVVPNAGIVTVDGPHLVIGIAAWGAALLTAVILAWAIRVGSSSPLHRNRLRYWLLALFMVAVGMTLTLTLNESMLPALTGGGVILLGSGLAVISWGFYYLPDIRVGVRRALSYIILTIVTFAIYLIGIRLTRFIFPTAAGQESIIGAVLVASVLAVAYAPLRQGVQILTRRLLGGKTIDYAAAVKEYSQSITHVLDLEPLAQIAVETTRSALGATRGALLVVDSSGDEGPTLEVIGGTGVQAGERMACPAASPITQRWRAGSALLQYDIDVLPAFRAVSPDERATLARWKMEVFFPVRTMGQLIGMLAVGSKKSGDPYFDSDMSFLATLADGTAVALQNARLFSDLRVAHQHTEELNRDLEQANDQLKELDRLKSAFIGVITHELRSPFAALDFSMQLIQRYGLDNLLPEQREQLSQLGEGLKHAQTMINNLITFASFLSKQGQLRTTPISLRQLVNETLTTLEPMARSRQIKLVLDCGAVPLFQGDRDRLGEALYHLVQNGIKFNQPGGTVTVRCQSAPEDVIVEVEDTGVGISQERLPEMWQDFTQVADPLKRGVEGLGLGLPLVRYVVKAHGGQVWARSELGKGSVFGFRIPKQVRTPD